jgi:hypothetical protein
MGTIELRSFNRRAGARAMAAALLLAALGGCSVDGLVGDASLPSGVNDPVATETPEGALSVYRGALAIFATAFGGVPAGFAPTTFIPVTGVLSDELQDGSLIGLPPAAFNLAGVDIRLLPQQTNPDLETFTGTPSVYAALQQVRGQAQEALGLLRDFPPQASPALQSHVYAIEGYSEVMLADLYCSGIPLSTLDYKGDYTLRPGSSTGDVYEHAAALFDTALTLAGDSARFVGLAQIGKGRALLALGHFADAAAAVQAVPDGYTYAVRYGPAAVPQNFGRMPGPSLTWDFSVSDREGGTGLDYRGSADPRTASTGVGVNIGGVALFHPDKYGADGMSPIVLADWVEARLIEAEAALQAGDAATWLAKLNHLRETAITPALADTTDPGTADARVDLTFRERAFWLFLTGHRQGDLRRLVRLYGRSPDQVYPIGIYPGGGAQYGSDVTAPIPAAERVSNPLFTGCLSRGA